jgi:plastocyanin
MKYMYALIALVIIAGGVWYFADQRSPDAMEDGNGTPNPASGTMLEGSEMPDNGLVGGDAAMGNDAGGEGMTLDVTANPDVVVNLTGANFRFSKGEIRVKQGDIVQINFTAGDMQHDWVVDEFNARTAIVPAGQSTSVTFVADKKGTFEYYCSVGQHRANGMVGTLIVE